MERQKGSRPALKAYLLVAVGLVLPLWAAGGVLEQQEWVLIRTADGTVIASNYTWGGDIPITLKADLSKLFGERLCNDGRLHSINPDKPYSLEGVSEGLGNRCENDGERDLNRDLYHTAFYGCPEPPAGKRQTCGGGMDYYCKNWGCETIVQGGGWSPGGGIDKHIDLQRDKRDPPKNQDPRCAQGMCNPIVIRVLNPSDPLWVKGWTWGVRLYVTGRDPGLLFTVRKLPTVGNPS